MKRYLMAQRQLYSCAAGLMAVVAVIPEGHAASALPLRDGEYATVCTGGVPDIIASIGYHKGVLSPQGEGQGGYCPVRNVKAVGHVYSGSSNCHEGTPFPLRPEHTGSATRY